MQSCLYFWQGPPMGTMSANLPTSFCIFSDARSKVLIESSFTAMMLHSRPSQKPNKRGIDSKSDCTPCVVCNLSAVSLDQHNSHTRTHLLEFFLLCFDTSFNNGVYLIFFLRWYVPYTNFIRSATWFIISKMYKSYKIQRAIFVQLCWA